MNIGELLYKLDLIIDHLGIEVKVPEGKSWYIVDRAHNNRLVGIKSSYFEAWYLAKYSCSDGVVITSAEFDQMRSKQWGEGND